jgi:hypothetical protein
MMIKLQAQYPLGPGIAVYKTDRPGVAHALFERFGFWEQFKEDVELFKEVVDAQEPSFLALYHQKNIFTLVHFRVLPNNENPGWTLFVVYEHSDKKELAERFVNSVYDRTAAELTAEPDVHIHIQKNSYD